MTAAYLTSRTMEVNLGGVWTDITSDVVSPIKAIWGISGNGPLDRVATVGTMTFDLNNVTKKYTPGSATSDLNWKKGIAIRLTLAFDGASYRRFYGFIDDLSIQSGEWGSRRVTVHCVDWMDIASNYPILLPQAYANKRADEGVSIIVAAMPIQPLIQSLAVTDDTFDAIFDVVKAKTKALTEFAKLTLSEFGYIYLRKDKVNGETLVIEGRHDRDAGISQYPIPVSTAAADKMLMETGDHLLLETGDKIVLDERTTFDFNLAMTSLDTAYGKNFSNYVTVRNYPRLIGNTVQVLYKINSVIHLAAGETKSNIRGAYTDPTAGGTQINGNTMIAPVAGTDYKMTANQNGTGTDLTANLSVTADYGTDAVTYSITNTGVTDGYVQWLQARGYPVYIYNPVEQFVSDSVSILANGYQELAVDQKYSPTLLPNIGLAQVLLRQEKDAKTVVNKMYALANTSYEHMASFLNLDVGHLIKVVENQTGTNNFYFIQQVEFTIDVSGIVNYAYVLKEAVSLSDVYWTLETAGYSELEQTTFVAY